MHPRVRNRYYDDGSGSCVPCSGLCATCSSATTCTSCGVVATVQLYLRGAGGAACVSSCPDGTFGDVTTSMCRPCAASCSTCAGPNESQCTSCLAPPRQLTGPAPAACGCMPGCVSPHGLVQLQWCHFGCLTESGCCGWLHCASVAFIVVIIRGSRRSHSFNFLAIQLLLPPTLHNNHNPFAPSASFPLPSLCTLLVYLQLLR
jgi:hypothetical protein